MIADLLTKLHPDLSGPFDLTVLLDRPVISKWRPQPGDQVILYVATNDGKIVVGRDAYGQWWEVRLTAMLAKKEMLPGQVIFLTEDEPKVSRNSGRTYRVTHVQVVQG